MSVQKSRLHRGISVWGATTICLIFLALAGCGGGGGGGASVSDKPTGDDMVSAPVDDPVEDPVDVPEEQGLWRIIKTEIDSNNDGSVDVSYMNDFNSAGMCTRREYENDCYFYIYDDDGNKVAEELDSDKDGAVDQYFFYTYDAAGNMVTEERDDGDGTVDLTISYGYDSAGNVVNELWDDGNEKTMTMEYTYDANGYLMKAETDFLNDGSIDAVSMYTYNADGFYLTMEYDLDNDGSIERSTAYEYDDNGNRISETKSNQTSINAGYPYSRHTVFTLDADNNVIKEQVDDTALGWDDGAFDETTHFVYDSLNYSRTFDMTYLFTANPWKKHYFDKYTLKRFKTFRFENTWEKDSDGDGIIDMTEDVTINPDGFPVKSEADFDSDGTIDQTRIYTWDAFL